MSRDTKALGEHGHHWVFRGPDAGYHCLAPDQRGYSPGGRPAQAQSYPYEELAADALAFGRELGGRFHLVGHDWGAIAGWLTWCVLQDDGSPARLPAGGDSPVQLPVRDPAAA